MSVRPSKKSLKKLRVYTGKAGHSFTMMLAARHMTLMKIYLHAPRKVITKKTKAATRHTVEHILSN
jgi:hypothetical protein